MSRSRIKSYTIILVVMVIISLIITGQFINIKQLLLDSLEAIRDLKEIGVLLFIGLYIIATILFIPGTPLTLGAGIIFDLVWGSIYVFIGATLGAIAAFLVGRYLMRDWVTQQLANHTKFQAIDQAVARQGLFIVFLTRLSPVFPFNLLNYLFGITQVSLKDYTMGSIGMIPGTITYVYIGSLAQELTKIGSTDSPNTPIFWFIKGLGFIATIIITIYITKIAKTALSNQLSEKE